MYTPSSHYQVNGDRLTNRHQCSRCSDSFQFAFQLRKHLSSHLIKPPGVYIHDIKVSPDTSEAQILMEKSVVKEDASLCKSSWKILPCKQRSDRTYSFCESNVVDSRAESCSLKQSVQSSKKQHSESLARGPSSLKRLTEGTKVDESPLPTTTSGASVDSAKGTSSKNCPVDGSVVTSSDKEAVSGNKITCNSVVTSAKESVHRNCVLDADSLHHGTQCLEDQAGSLTKRYKRFPDCKQRMIESDLHVHEKERSKQVSDTDIAKDSVISQPGNSTVKSLSLDNGTEESSTFPKEAKSSQQMICKERMYHKDDVESDKQGTSQNLKSAVSVTSSIGRRGLGRPHFDVGKMAQNACKAVVETPHSDTIKSVTQEASKCLNTGNREVLSIQQENRKSVGEISTVNCVHADLRDKSSEENQSLHVTQHSGLVTTNLNDFVLPDVAVKNVTAPSVQLDSCVLGETNLHGKPTNSSSLESAAQHSFNCHICDTYFSTNSGLALHLLAHRRKDIFSKFIEEENRQTKAECKSFTTVLKPKPSESENADSNMVFKAKPYEDKCPHTKTTLKVKAKVCDTKCSDTEEVLKAKDSVSKCLADGNSGEGICSSKGLVGMTNLPNSLVVTRNSDAESLTTELVLKKNDSRSKNSTENGMTHTPFVEIKSPIRKEVTKEKTSEKESTTESVRLTNDVETKSPTSGNVVSTQETNVSKANEFQTKFPSMPVVSEPNIFDGTGTNKVFEKHSTTKCPTLYGMCMAKHSKNKRRSVTDQSIADSPCKRPAVSSFKLYKNIKHFPKLEMPNVLNNNIQNLNKTAKTSISSESATQSKINKTHAERKNPEGTKKVEVPCPYCHRYVSKKNLSRHRSLSCRVLNRPSSKITNCHVCSEPVMAKHLSSHLEIFHGLGILRKRSCNVCFRNDFESFNSLQQHKKTHLLDKKDIKLSYDEDFDKGLPGCGHLCAICNIVRLNANNIRSHIISHMLEKMSIRYKLRRGKRFLCPVCLKSIDLQSRIESHILSHWKIKLFVCPIPICQQEFTRFDVLERHCKKYHYREADDDKSQICTGIKQQIMEEQSSQPPIN